MFRGQWSDGGRYRRIFDQECKSHGMTMPDDVFAVIVNKVQKEKGLERAAFQPRFIVERVVATCRFLGQQPHFEPRFIDYAMDNLGVRHSTSPSRPADTSAQISG